jgi:NAD+ dependent glucose-6-phosphate dehydrogenase
MPRLKGLMPPACLGFDCSDFDYAHYWMKRNVKVARVLITGANGLIGRILWTDMIGKYDLHGIDLTGPFSEQVVELDLAELAPLAEYVKKISPVDCILHLAGQSNVDASWEAVLRANIIGTRNVYETARLFQVRRVVFASSNHVTGAYEGLEPRLHLENEPERITVHSPVRPDSDYAVSKVFGEAEARYYCARWGIESVCLRIGSVRPDDDPTGDPRWSKTWLSRRDLLQLFDRSMHAPVAFGVYYGVSNNRGAFWDISNARSELGYDPVDDASEHAASSQERR